MTPETFVGWVFIAQIAGTLVALALHDLARGRRDPTPETPASPVSAAMQARRR